MRPELTTADRCKGLMKRIAGVMFTAAGGFGLFRLLARPGITIIAYHRIVEDDRSGIVPYIAVRQSALREQIQFFKRHYRVISLEDALAQLRAGPIGEHYLVLTFDDGYRDFLTLGLPVFRAEGVCPSIFLTTGCMESGVPLWPDLVREYVYGAEVPGNVTLPQEQVRIGGGPAARISAVVRIIAFLKTLGPEERDAFLARLRGAPEPVQGAAMLSWDEVRTLAREKMSLGAHTIHHAILSGLRAEDAEGEIRGSRDAIAAVTGEPVLTFAYPNGMFADYDQTHVQMLTDLGFTGAVTTERGFNGAGSDPFRLKRTGVYLTDRPSDIRFKLAFEYFVSFMRRSQTKAHHRSHTPGEER